MKKMAKILPFLFGALYFSAAIYVVYSWFVAGDYAAGSYIFSPLVAILTLGLAINGFISIGLGLKYNKVQKAGNEQEIRAFDKTMFISFLVLGFLGLTVGYVQMASSFLYLMLYRKNNNTISQK